MSENDIISRAGITPQALAFSLPGALANLASNGTWQYAPHLKLLEDKLLEVASGKCKRLLVSLPPRSGKPIYEEELILMGDGSYKKLKDVKINDLVITHEGRPKKVLAVHVQGKLPCKLIESFLGNEVIAAYDHPFLTADGWKNVSDLKVGDVLAVINNPKLISKNPLADIAKFAVAGYLIGDGSTNGKGASFTNEDPDIIDDFCEQVANLGIGFTTTIRPKKGNKASEILIKANCNRGNSKFDPNRLTISKWINDIGLKGNSYTKEIPEWVFLGTDEQIGAFIGAFFSCDGTISIRRPHGKLNKKGACAELNTVNQYLMKQTLMLLHRLGIRWKLRRRDGTYKNDLYISYRLCSTSETSVIDFFEKTRVIGAKQKRFSDWNVSRKEFPSKFHADEITRIIPFGDWPCRCLTVEGDATFTANNFVVHNSELISKYFPAWFLGRFPDKNIILASYEASFAATWGRAARNVLEEHGEKIFGVKIAQDSAAADHWSIQGHVGGMHTAGAGGSITGRGGDLIILDDVLKNDKEALSSVIQNNIYNWYQSTVYTRQAPNAAIIILMTRWSKEDLIGKLIDDMNEDGGEQWDVLNFPAIAEEHDILGRAPGEALWPERFPIKVLERYRKTMGNYWFSCTPEETPILMADWSMKPIKDVKIGDEVIGFTQGTIEKRGRLIKSKVLNTFKKQDLVYDLKMLSGRTVRCTADHRWYTGRHKEKNRNRKIYDVPKIGKKLQFVIEPLKELSINEKLDWMYLSGIFDGEGSMGGKTGRMSVIGISTST